MRPFAETSMPDATRLAPPDVSGECELTILMPCLDEAETIAACVAKARRFLEREGVRGEVLVADNGSRDGSPELARSAGARVQVVLDKGYGAALIGGIRAARGRFVIMGDADDSYDFAALGPFLDALRRGADLVMGNRFRGGIRPGAMPLLHRYLGNPVLSALGRLFFGVPVGDFHCGLRGFRRDAILALGLSAPGMEFASELVVKAGLRRLAIAEVPTVLSPDGRSRRPHLRTWRDGWRHLRFLLLFSPNWLFLYPGLALMAAGALSMAWLLPGTRQIDGIGLDVNTLVYSAVAIVGGFQAVALALFAKIFAIDAGLLPSTSRMVHLAHRVTLEAGIVVGLVLLAGGIAASGWAVELWGASRFGRLDPSASLRLVVPAATAILLGLQIIASSFFIGVLGLIRREPG
jgi:glycosyltransferase involved in cell wall biosynthesis